MAVVIIMMVMFQRITMYFAHMGIWYCRSVGFHNILGFVESLALLHYAF